MVDLLSGDLKGRWIECLVRPLGRGRLSMPPAVLWVRFGGALAPSGSSDAVDLVAWFISVSV